jgi:multimeric flavodoxin WrbA
MENVGAEKSRLLIHDLDRFSAQGLLPVLPEDVIAISALPAVKSCVGCFGCWIKTPGRCVIDDRIADVPGIMGRSRELILVSELTYGGLSPDLKAIIDRMIPSMLPFFTVVDGKTRHRPRYARETDFALSYYFYRYENTEGLSIEGESDKPLQSFAKAHGEAAADTPGGEAHDGAAAATPLEKELALMERLVESNAKNLSATHWKAVFVGDKMNLSEVAF